MKTLCFDFPGVRFSTLGSPQLPSRYNVVAEKAFREICKKLESEIPCVYVMGRTADKDIGSLNVTYKNAPDGVEKAIFAALLKINLANFDANFLVVI